MLAQSSRRTAAAPVAGPPFELDQAVFGSAARGDQWPVATAARDGGGTLVAWFDFDPFIRAPRSDQLMLLASLVPDTGSPPAVPIRVPYHSVYTTPVAAAAVEDGYLLVYHDGSGIVATRVDADGQLVDEDARPLVPGARYPLRLAVACDPHSDHCLLIWSESTPWAPATPIVLLAVGFGWNQPPGSVVTLAQDEEEWTQPRGSVAAGIGLFGVVYSMRKAVGDQRKLFVRLVAADGQPMADAVELPVTGSFSPPLLARLADGFLMAWGVLDADELLFRGVRLDGSGHIVGPIATVSAGLMADDGVAVSSEGDAVSVFRTGLSTADRFDARWARSSFAAPTSWAHLDAAFDGARYWLTAGSQEVWIAPADVGAKKASDWTLLSRADNTQWLSRVVTARDRDGNAYGLVEWTDNASVDPGDPNSAWPAVVQAFGPDGCPLQRPRAATGNPAAGVAGISADDDGYALLDDSGGLWRLQLDGTDAGGAVTVAVPDEPWSARANVGGGFTITTKSSARRAMLIDGHGATIGDVAIPYAAGSSTYAVGIGQEVAVVSEQADCAPDGSCTGAALHLDFRDLEGRESRSPIVVPLGDALEMTLFTTRLGYVVALSDGSPSWRAGLLSPDGTWNGLSSIDVDGPTTLALADVAVQGDELWWLGIADATGADPGQLWSVRTTPEFERLESTDLGVAAPPIGRAALLPAASQPTLLSSYYQLAPRSVRIAGHRLDGTTCTLPDLAAPAAGCSCRSSATTVPGEALAVLLLLLVAGRVRAARRSGR